jgi:two-component system response regulator NreC
MSRMEGRSMTRLDPGALNVDTCASSEVEWAELRLQVGRIHRRRAGGDRSLDPVGEDGWTTMAVGVSDEDSPIRIVLADDHPVVRSGLRLLLDEEPDLQVIAEASTADEALCRTRGQRPEVLVLDLSMPGRSSLEVIPEIRRAVPRTAIVVLTMHEDPALVRDAMRGGAAGYVLKEAADTELLHALRAAAAGEVYVNPSLAAGVAREPAASGPPDGLTEREVEVLRLIALGYTNTEIASQLHLSVRTIESHRAHIQYKIRRTSRSELVHYAFEYGLVDVQL